MFSCPSRRRPASVPGAVRATEPRQFGAGARDLRDTVPYRGSSRPLPVPHLQNCALEPLKQRLCEAPSENRRAALLASRCAHATGARAGGRGQLQDTAGGPAELVSPTPHLAPALGAIRAIFDGRPTTLLSSPTVDRWPGTARTISTV